MVASGRFREYKKHIAGALAGITISEELRQAERVKGTYHFQLASRISRRDLSNLIKHIEDIIHEAIGMDDATTYEIEASKRQAKDKKESANISLLALKKKQGGKKKSPESGVKREE